MLGTKKLCGYIQGGRMMKRIHKDKKLRNLPRIVRMWEFDKEKHHWKHLSSTKNQDSFCLWLANSYHMTWMLVSDWWRVITCPGFWPLICWHPKVVERSKSDELCKKWQINGWHCVPLRIWVRIWHSKKQLIYHL